MENKGDGLTFNKENKTFDKPTSKMYYRLNIK